MCSPGFPHSPFGREHGVGPSISIRELSLVLIKGLLPVTRLRESRSGIDNWSLGVEGSQPRLRKRLNCV